MSSFRGPRVVFVLALASLVAPAWANEESASLVEDARRKLRHRDTPAALGSLAAAVAADPGDADAQILYQDTLRRDRPGPALLAQYRAAAESQPDDPLRAFLAARLLKPEDAAREFSAHALRFRESPWPHEGRAAALDALGRAKDAAAAHDAAIAANPREPRFRVSQARGFERAGQWGQAVESWKLAVQLRPGDRALLIGLGEALRRAGLLDEAVLQFEAAAKLDPADPEPPYRIGLARLDAKRHDDALKSFDAAIALDKGYVDPHCAAVRAALRRAHDHAAAAKRDVAEADLAPAIDYGTRAVKADGSSAAARVALGNAEEAAAELVPSHAENALREYDAALALLPATNPDRVAALAGRAYACVLLDRSDDAIAAAEMAIDQDERAIAAYLAAGQALAGRGEPDEAIKKFFGPGLRIAPDDAKLRHARGISHWDMAKLNDARKDLEAAVKAEPGNGRFQLSLGELYYQLRMYKQASEALLVASDLRQNDPVTWRALGRACTSLKEWEQAAFAFEQVVLLVEGDPSAAKPEAPPPSAPGGAPQGPAPGAPAPPAPDGPAPGAPSAGQPPAPPPGGAAAAEPPAEPKLATNEHLYLALIYGDHLDQREKAKLHIRKFVEQGGTNTNLDAWIQGLLADK